MSSKSFCVSAGGLSSASVSVAWAGGSWTDAQIRKMCVLIIMYTLHKYIYIYIHILIIIYIRIQSYTWCTINWYQLYYYNLLYVIIIDYIHLWYLCTVSWMFHSFFHLYGVPNPKLAPAGWRQQPHLLKVHRAKAPQRYGKSMKILGSPSNCDAKSAGNNLRKLRDCISVRRFWLICVSWMWAREHMQNIRATAPLFFQTSNDLWIAYLDVPGIP